MSRWTDDSEPIHGWFELTYSNYLVMPRSVLQSMPQEWQAKFCDLLDEAKRDFGHLDWPKYRVLAIGNNGRFRKDPIPHYNRGRTRLEAKSDQDV